jgi:type I restriction enzyme S subunit
MSAYPSHWIQTEIGKVSEVVTGKTPPTTNPHYYNGEIPFVKPPDLDADPPLLATRDSVTAAGAETGRLLPEGTVAVSCIGNLGKVALLGKPAITNQQINAIIPTAGLESKFVYFWAKTLKPWLEQNASATTVAIINKGRFSMAPIGVPPLNEQRRIVAKIEDLTARSQAARQALDAIPPLLERFRQSVLAAAFRGDLTKQWRQQNPDVEPATELLKRIRQERRHRWEQDYLALQKAKGKTPKDDKWKEKYQEAEPVDTTGLPELPEGWCWVDVETLASDSDHALSSGPFGSSLGTKDYVEVGVPVIRGQNIRNGGVVLDSDFVFVSPQKAEELTRSSAKPGDVIVVAVGSSGRSAVVIEKLPRAVLSQNCNKVTCEQELVDPCVLNHFLGCDFAQERIAGRTTDTVRKFFSLTNFRRIPVPLPPRAEQEMLLQLLDDLLRRLGESQSACITQNNLLATLDQAILAKAFRGELVPQDPNDEPASALLNRIRTEREAADSASGVGRRKAKVKCPGR